MSGYDFVSSIFLRSKCDRRDNPALFNALNKLIHILINFHLEGMVGKIINFQNGHIINSGELIFFTLRIIHKELIVPGQAKIDFLHVLQFLSPPS